MNAVREVIEGAVEAGIAPADITVRGLLPQQAKAEFLRRFSDLRP